MGSCSKVVNHPKDSSTSASKSTTDVPSKTRKSKVPFPPRKDRPASSSQSGSTSPKADSPKKSRKKPSSSNRSKKPKDDSPLSSTSSAPSSKSKKGLNSEINFVTSTMSDSFISNPSACHDSLYPRSSLSNRVASRVAPPPSSARPSVLETANEIFPPSRHYNDRPSFSPRDWSQHVACARPC